MVNLNQFELNFSDQDAMINYRSKLATFNSKLGNIMILIKTMRKN
jgi:hypothetical protein